MNKWGKEGDLPNDLNIIFIQPKTMVGAIDKSLEYVIKQSEKVLQNPKSNSERKQRHELSKNAVQILNWILQKNIKKVEVIRHKYYSGTWGTSVIFNDGNQYSEYNAGSGEFLIAYMVDKIERLNQNCLLLLDEPEVSLHPGAQKRLMCYILEVIKKKKLQVVITTHSTNIVEYLPKKAIKCFRKIENEFILIEQDVIYQHAFIELEADIPNKKHIIVEDDMAKNILDKIIQAENLNGLLQVGYYPGGASNIKKYTLLTYSKTSVPNRFFILDRDQKKEDIPNFENILEKDKTEPYLKDVFYKSVGIKADKLEWCIDANSQKGRCNEEQKKKLLFLYLEYFKKHVYFLPKKIPEDIVFDVGRLKVLLGEEDFPDISEEEHSKAKIKKISDVTREDVHTIENYLIYWFIKSKNEDYQTILSILKQIIGE